MDHARRPKGMRGDEVDAMSNVSQLQTFEERNEKRRLHLREVTADNDQAQDAQETPVAADAEPPEPKETPGDVLRAARTARGEDVATVAAKLKMRRDQLEAIETGDYAKLPGRTYVFGFVRTYARYLGLDAEALVQRIKDESAGDADVKAATLVFPEATEERQILPNGSILIWAMLIAMVIYGITYVTMPDRKSATTAKADQPAVVIEDAGAVAPQTESSVTDAWRAATREPPVTYVAGAQVLPQSSEAEGPRLLTDDPALPREVAFEIAQVTDVVVASAPAQSTGSRVTFKALEATYIQIKDSKLRGGRAVLVSRVLNPGESYEAPNRTGLVMQTGNAGGLQVEVDGRVIGVLGKGGEVITRIPLDPSYFLERIAASQ
jgi:cytoskeleton protein RodZ